MTYIFPEKICELSWLRITNKYTENKKGAKSEIKFKTIKLKVMKAIS